MKKNKEAGVVKNSAPSCGNGGKGNGGYHECGLSTVAKCLKNSYNKTKLYVKMDCPDAVIK